VFYYKKCWCIYFSDFWDVMEKQLRIEWYHAFPKFHLLLNSPRLWFLTAIPKCLNCATYLRGLQATFILWSCPSYQWSDMKINLHTEVEETFYFFYGITQKINIICSLFTPEYRYLQQTYLNNTLPSHHESFAAAVTLFTNTSLP
jgi:hypothetical protein